MTRITILANDTAIDGLQADHGFALLIEYGGKNILFDTGADTAFLQNCKTLGVNFSSLDAVVLSHGHYDHGGNLAYVLHHATNAQFYAHENFTATRYSIKEGVAKYVGLSPQNKNFAKHRSFKNCHLIGDEALEILPDVWLTGYVSRATAYEDTGGPFYCDKAGKVEDELPDDLSLYINSLDGIVLCLGCCHSGIINTIDNVLNNTQQNRFSGILGGMHLINATENRLNKTFAALKNYNIGKFIPCHCTGDKAQEMFTDKFGSITTKGMAGQVWEF